MILAYPGANTVHSEAISVRSFIDALADKSLAQKVREREPRSLDEAYKIALRLDSFRKADLDVDGAFEKRYGRVKTVKESDTATNSLMRRLDQPNRPMLLSK